MDPLTSLSALLALLLGLAVGKAWERYKLQDGRLIDRRRARESPHYMLGLNFLVTGQIDPAIEELTRAAQLTGDALEIRLILGNLYREKGQVGRAIQEHQALLQRPNLRKLEHANVLLCLGLDYKRGGFVDRALEAFNEVLRLEPGNEYALINLQKLYEEQHQWQDAYAARQKLTAGAAADDKPRHQRILAFPRHETAYAKSSDANRFPELCRRLIEQTPQDWRARLALAGHLGSNGHAADGLEILFEALAVNPHALAIHQAIWGLFSAVDHPRALVDRYFELTRQSVFYVDPHICVRCRYRSTELLWRCPQCHEWDTFVEERIAPARDTDALA